MDGWINKGTAGFSTFEFPYPRGPEKGETAPPAHRCSGPESKSYNSDLRVARGSPMRACERATEADSGMAAIKSPRHWWRCRDSHTDPWRTQQSKAPTYAPLDFDADAKVAQRRKASLSSNAVAS